MTVVYRGDPGWTLQNLHFTQYLSNENTLSWVCRVPIMFTKILSIQNMKTSVNYLTTN